MEPGGSFDVELVEERPGYVAFIARGGDAVGLFAPEAGGHRWQRVPPTEKRGRRQTSTITVAVLPLGEDPAGDAFSPADVEIVTCRGSGAGGQHRNTTDSAVQALHKPTGIRVRCEGERSQHANRRAALMILAARVAAAERSRQTCAVNETRRKQVGSGQRGDKCRTIRTQDGAVTSHETGRKMPLERYLKGFVDEIH